MQKQNWSSFVIALIYMALGVVFIIRPEGVESILCYILAAALAVMGLLYLLGYFISPVGADGRRSGNGFVIGILLIFMALFIVVKQELIISLVPFLFGVMILIRGLFTVQAAFYMKRISGRFLEPVIAGLVLMGLGLFIMLFPFETAKVLFILIGVGMILGGLMAIAEEIVVRIMVRRREHDLERARDMAHAVDAADAAGIAKADAADVADADTADTAAETAVWTAAGQADAAGIEGETGSEKEADPEA